MTQSEKNHEQLRLYTFSRSNGQKRLSHPGAKASNDCSGSRNLPILVLKQRHERIKRDKPCIDYNNPETEALTLLTPKPASLITPVRSNSRIPALTEFPTINVVHPAYHCFPNGGHGSFFESGSLRLSCDRVFATDIYIFWLDRPGSMTV